MSNHYVYLLQHRDTGMSYIGSRTCKCRIGSDKYMGSSSAMTQEDKAGCNKIILKRFSTRKEAIAYEIELHEEFDVGVNPLFWNKAKQTSTGFDTTGSNVNHTSKHKKYLSESRKAYNKTYGNPGAREVSLETRLKLSEAGKNWYKHNVSKSKGRKLTEEHKKKINPIGRTHSEEAKGKIRETHCQNACNHKGFKPWWYEVGGIRTEVYDKTIKEFAEEHKVNFHIVKDRFRKQYVGEIKQSEPFKGYIFGRL